LSNNNATGPLIVSPRWQSSKDFLKLWCEANCSWTDDMILLRGDIIISGFGLRSPSDMEQTIKSYNPQLSYKYCGTSPRKLQDGTDFVFCAAGVPANYPIVQHIEMSFLSSPPAQLYFGCVKPSTSVGGKTALHDFRQVAKQLPDDLKQKLIDKGIRYTRMHKKV
jgi:Taurine catabolism dioxygenase TauD, TfdA family